MKKSSIPVVYGIFVAIGLIAYFLLLSVFGLHKYPAFSVLNMVISGVGILFAIKKFRLKKGAKFKYQEGFMAGLVTGFIATIIFTIFFAVYTTELNPGFQEELITMWDSDYFVTIGMLVFTVALMGFASSFVLSLAFMQLLKPSWNTKDAAKHTY